MLQAYYSVDKDVRDQTSCVVLTSRHPHHPPELPSSQGNPLGNNFMPDGAGEVDEAKYEVDDIVPIP